MYENRRNPTTGRQSPFLFDKWHGIFYIPSRTDTSFDYAVLGHWWQSQSVQSREWDSNRQRIGLESNTLPTEPPRLLPCHFENTPQTIWRPVGPSLLVFPWGKCEELHSSTPLLFYIYLKAHVSEKLSRHQTSDNRCCWAKL